LYGKNPVKPAASAAAAAASAAALSGTSAKSADSNKADAKASPKGEIKPAVSADPLGDLAKAKSAAGSAAEPFLFFVQLGAYRTAEDAETQRAKLSLSGIETKITEREQSGRVVFRVRTGPFESKEEAERNKDKLDKAGLETSLVRVQR
jgi:cell division protein FtsN